LRSTGSGETKSGTRDEVLDPSRARHDSMTRPYVLHIDQDLVAALATQTAMPV
jgi:hypothetical protein